MACMAGGMCDWGWYVWLGDVWLGGCVAGGHAWLQGHVWLGCAWLGVCVAGEMYGPVCMCGWGVHGWGACVTKGHAWLKGQTGFT